VLAVVSDRVCAVSSLLCRHSRYVSVNIHTAHTLQQVLISLKLCECLLQAWNVWKKGAFWDFVTSWVQNYTQIRPKKYGFGIWFIFRFFLFIFLVIVWFFFPFQVRSI
jgi:hypothetical protein